MDFSSNEETGTPSDDTITSTKQDDDEFQNDNIVVTPNDEQPEVESTPVEFVISVIQYVDIDGNTYVYMGTEDGTVYKAIFKDNEKRIRSSHR